MWAVVTWSYFVLVFESGVWVGRSVVVVLECERDIFSERIVKRISGNEKLPHHLGYHYCSFRPTLVATRLWFMHSRFATLAVVERRELVNVIHVINSGTWMCVLIRLIHK